MHIEKLKVSIIIPVYNVGPYIQRCLMSVCTQTYHNIEIVIVDDCGNDDSMNIAHKFIEQHPELHCKLMKHAYNKGLSAARNTGLTAATGDYVYFLDSDDSLSIDAIEVLVTPLEKYPYEMVIGDYITETEDKPIKGNSLKLSQDELLGNELILKTYADGLWYVMAWNKLCNRTFLLNNQLFFTEGLLHEDVIWTFKLACKLKSMFSVKKPTYIYLVRSASIMTSMSIEKDALIYLKAFNEIIHFVHQENRMYGIHEYRMIEGKKSGILYSLLQKKEIQLYNKLYPFFHQQCYISPWKAYQKRIIDIRYFLRDIHYCLPISLGRIYKRMFYYLFYAMRGKHIEGIVWK